MQYVKAIDGNVIKYPYTTLFSDHKNVSFIMPLTEETLNEFDVYTVYESAKPELAWNEDWVENDPVFDGTKWVQSWSKRVLSVEETRAKTDALWEQIRIKRNRLLAECDWTQLSDSPVDKTAWAEYRQILRDLPDNWTDPRLVVWPEPPFQINT